MRFSCLALVALAVLSHASQAYAEDRTVLVQIKQGKDQKALVSIYSDEKKEQKSAVSTDEAVKVLDAMQGWRSAVHVYVTSDRGVGHDDLKRVLGAINDNGELDLEYFGREVPKAVGDLFLKKASAQEGEPKAAIGVWMGIQHWLYIFSDGSGTVGFGDGGGPFQGHFKAGTFDVDQVTKQLKALPAGEREGPLGPYGFNLESERKGPDEPGPTYNTTDRKLIPSLFDKAYKASGLDKPFPPAPFGERKDTSGHDR